MKIAALLVLQLLSRVVFFAVSLVTHALIGFAVFLVFACLAIASLFAPIRRA